MEAEPPQFGDRHQGAVGRSAAIGSKPGTVIHTLGYPLRAGGIRRQLRLRDARRLHLDRASSSASITRIRCSIRTPRSTASSGIRSSARMLDGGRWCATAPRRCPRAAGTRMPRLLRRRRASSSATPASFVNSMRLKGIHLAMRYRDARRRDRVRRRRRGDDVARRGLRQFRRRSTPAPIRARAVARVAASTRRSATACSPGLHVRRRVDRHARLVAASDCTARRATDRMRMLAVVTAAVAARCLEPRPDAVTPDRQAHVRQAHQRALLGHRARRRSAGASARAHRGVPLDLRRASTGIPCQRFCPANVYEIVATTGRRDAAADQRVELRPLQDAATSWIRTGDHTWVAA